MPDDADNFFKSDKVTQEKVSFDNQYQMKVVGNLFIPKAADRSARSPAIIVGHPMGAVKEQSADLYAQKLAEQGFVDRQRIGVLGICGSGSFVISAAKIDPRMKAIATVSMYDMGAANRNGLRHSQPLEQRQQTIAAAAEQRYVEFAGGKTRYTSGTVHELTDDTHPIQREFFDFYRTARGQFTPSGSSPELTTHPTLTSNTKFMNFYPFRTSRRSRRGRCSSSPARTPTPASSAKRPSAWPASPRSCTSSPTPGTWTCMTAWA